MIHALKGTYTALITPFHDDGTFDKEAFQANIQYQVNQGVEGIVVLGTTAEVPTLNDHEKELSIQIARETLDKASRKVSLWVGTGSYSTEETIKSTLRAQALGADGALVVTPYYNKPTQEGLYQHFKALVKATELPICVYNIQGRTGLNMTTDTLMRLMDFPQIVAVKEASGNISQIMEVIENSRPGFSVLSGDDNLTLPVIALGGVGVISVLSNLLPAEVKQLTDTCLAGDFEQARSLHYRLLPLVRHAFIETNPAPVKFMMNQMGMKAGTLRLPLVPVTEMTEGKLIQCLKEWEKSPSYTNA